MPLHARVTNTSVAYAQAFALELRQDRILAGAAVAVLGAVVLR